MSGFELVAGVIAAFFAFGIMMGVLAMIALGATRRDRLARRLDWENQFYWEEPPGPDGDEGPPPWPGYRGLLAGGR